MTESDGGVPALVAQWRQILERLRWSSHLCGACGEGYLMCRGCTTGIKAGLRSVTDRSAQCGGHSDIPCGAECFVEKALCTTAELEAAWQARPEPDCRFMRPERSQPCAEVYPENENRWCGWCLLKKYPQRAAWKDRP